MKNNYTNYKAVMDKKFSHLDWSMSDPEDYDTLVWNEVNVPKPTKEFLDGKMQAVRRDYAVIRQRHYPSIEDQLDTLYHGGYEAWRASIDLVKTTFPKPE